MSKTLLAIDIGSANVIAVIAKNDLDFKINILGTGIESSDGINKGLITNLEAASKSIKNAVTNAKKSTSEVVNSVVVSISGAYTKGVRSSGSVNIPNGLITEHEINQVMQMALYNATIIPEYEVIHVVPIFFKVDDSASVENPLNMNGARLEVSVYIITAKKTALTNVKSALKESNLEVNNFVLNSYASSISVLDDQQKKFGATVVNMGSTTTDFITFKNNSIVYNDFIPVGSNHITNDLSVMLHTPPNAAEALKLKYGSLLFKDNNNLEIKKVKLPRIGDENETSEVGIDSVRTIIHARVEEDLMLIKNKIRSIGLNDNIGSGLILTGGMSKLKGIKELASKVFDEIPVKISNPLNIKNGYINFDDSSMSTIVGLLVYSLDRNKSFELDSNKKLRKKISIKRKVEPLRETHIVNTNNVKRKQEPSSKKTPIEDNNSMDSSLLPKISKNDKSKGISKFWNKISEWF